MLQSFTQFPHVGALCFRKHTAEPARILRHNADHTVLLERRKRLPDGSTRPIDGASANTTVNLSDVFADPETAIHGKPRPSRRSARARSTGRSGGASDSALKKTRTRKARG